MISIKEIELAQSRIRPHLFNTALTYEPLLSRDLGLSLHIKWENQQRSGSFKARGAFNKILSIPEEERKAAFFVAASTGNHAAAFCTALNILHLKGKVFLPENVSQSKLDFIKSMEVPFELHGRNSLHAELYCRKVANERNYTMVHPYNDREIIAGQGTCGAEISEQLPDVEAIVTPVGGGGLIAGIASYFNSAKPEVHIIGCQPSQSPEMVRSIEQGQIILEDISKPTLSDGTAGGMEPGSITFEICRDLVHEWALIDEDDIAFEIKQMLEQQQVLIEGAAALPLAHLRKNAKKYKGKKVVVVVTGKRISKEKLKVLLCN